MGYQWEITDDMKTFQAAYDRALHEIATNSFTAVSLTITHNSVDFAFNFSGGSSPQEMNHYIFSDTVPEGLKIDPISKTKLIDDKGNFLDSKLNQVDEKGQRLNSDGSVMTDQEIRIADFLKTDISKNNVLAYEGFSGWFDHVSKDVLGIMGEPFKELYNFVDKHRVLSKLGFDLALMGKTYDLATSHFDMSAMEFLEGTISSTLHLDTLEKAYNTVIDTEKMLAPDVLDSLEHVSLIDKVKGLFIPFVSATGAVIETVAVADVLAVVAPVAVIGTAGYLVYKRLRELDDVVKDVKVKGFDSVVQDSIKAAQKVVNKGEDFTSDIYKYVNKFMEGVEDVHYPDYLNPTYKLNGEKQKLLFDGALPTEKEKTITPVATKEETLNPPDIGTVRPLNPVDIGEKELNPPKTGEETLNPSKTGEETLNPPKTGEKVKPAELVEPDVVVVPHSTDKVKGLDVAFKHQELIGSVLKVVLDVGGEDLEININLPDLSALANLIELKELKNIVSSIQGQTFVHKEQYKVSNEKEYGIGSNIDPNDLPVREAEKKLANTRNLEYSHEVDKKNKIVRDGEAWQNLHSKELKEGYVDSLGVDVDKYYGHYPSLEKAGHYEGVREVAIHGVNDNVMAKAKGEQREEDDNNDQDHKDMIDLFTGFLLSIKTDPSNAKLSFTEENYPEEFKEMYKHISTLGLNKFGLPKGDDNG